MPPFLLIYKGGILLYPIISTEKYTNSDKYLWYDGFDKEGISYIDEDKKITIHESCVNLSQEDNSQYIPFEMERYYHGIDLMDMRLQIHFVNSQGGSNFCEPINVSYSDNRIRFGWLMDRNATAVSGTLMFEVRAIGTVSYKGEGEGQDLQYVWKTHTNSQITILKSLIGNTVFTASEDWYNKLVVSVNKQVIETANYKSDAETAATSAESYATSALESARDAQAALAELDIDVKSIDEKATFTNKCAELAKSWAVGNSNSDRADEDQNNAWYWSTQAQLAVSGLQGTVNTNATDIGVLQGRADTLSTNLETVNRDLTNEVKRAINAESGLEDSIDELEHTLTGRIENIESELGSKADTNSVTLAINTLTNSLLNKAEKSYVDNKIPTMLKNPYALTISGVAYDGSAAIDITDIINALIDAKIANIPTEPNEPETPEEPTDPDLPDEPVEEPTVYTVTYNLTGVTSRNTAETVSGSYTTTLTCDNIEKEISGIAVTMGGEDIKSTALVNETTTSAEISIPSVTGDIVITASQKNSTSN